MVVGWRMPLQFEFEAIIQLITSCHTVQEEEEEEEDQQDDWWLCRFMLNTAIGSIIMNSL